jgi:hypothetical protein
VLAARVVIGRQVEVHAWTIRGGQPNAKLARKASASSSGTRRSGHDVDAASDGSDAG